MRYRTTTLGSLLLTKRSVFGPNRRLFTQNSSRWSGTPTTLTDLLPDSVLWLNASGSPSERTNTAFINQSECDMRRRRRNSPTHDEPPVMKKSRTNMASRSRQASKTSISCFTSKQCIAWFHEYTGPDEDTIGPEGMEKFCEDIGVEPENIVMLCLAWKLDARNMGFFTLSEWLRGMTDLQADSVPSLQRKFDYLKSFLDDSTHFKDIYRYAYDFAREKDQRSMDIDTAKAMLTLLLGKNWNLYTYFHQFIEQSKYRVINKDQWCNILEFSRTIKSDLANYDEDGAWPVLLDEFVDWYRSQTGANSSSSPSQDHTRFTS